MLKKHIVAQRALAIANLVSSLKTLHYLLFFISRKYILFVFIYLFKTISKPLLIYKHDLALLM